MVIIMRVIKEYDERKKEILDSAERLFNTKGYENCTVNDILKEVSIAKGTFYYYFKSKQEVLDEIVNRYTEVVINRVHEILEDQNISPEEKLLGAFMSMQVHQQVGDSMMEEIHKAENALLHQKVLNQMVEAMTPYLVKIVEEGIQKKVWMCRYPQQYMQIFLASALTLTDDGIFNLDAEDQLKVMAALISVLEKMLEVPEDSFMNLFMRNQE
mgnify:FL=1